MKSKEIVSDNIERIKNLFPNVIKETEVGHQIDFDLLKQELSNNILDNSKERYQLTWPGKIASILESNTPTNKTLRPLKEKSVDFDNTENIYIEGDNLEVLKVLQESYLNKIKCIYIDPPYNTGNDFIYNDNFNKDIDFELEDSGQMDEESNRLVTNKESNGRFHSDWLSMMYPRLKLARNLLTDDGVIFISIDDNEVHNLMKLCDEIFGEGNFIANLVWSNKEGGGSSDSKHFRIKHENILVYAKEFNYAEIYGLPVQDIDRYTLIDEHVETRGKYQLIKLDSASIQYSTSLDYAILSPENSKIYPGNRKRQSCWRWSKTKVEWGIKNDFVVIKKDAEDEWAVYTKQYLNCDNEGKIIKRTIQPLGIIDKYSTTQSNKMMKNLMGGAIFQYSKPCELISLLLKVSTENNDIILDFFSGSATTAHATMSLNAEDGGNRKYIMVQLEEATDEKSEAYKEGYKYITDIGQERIRRAGKKIKEETNADIDYGFRVYKLDSSNMKDVYYKPSEYKQDQLELFENNIKGDRTSLDILTQVILDLGLTLDLKIEEKQIEENKIYFVETNALIACFDENINISIIDKLCQYKPLKLVFREHSFTTDSHKINFQERIKSLSPGTEVSIL